MSKSLRLLSGVILFLANVAYLSSSTETTFHNFTGGLDGSDPVGDLLYDPATGVVYGTTKTGGAGPNCAAGCGTVFSIHSSGTGYTVIYRFAGGTGDGSNPQAGLILDANGNLYGTTYNGGTHHLGTVFKLTPVGGGKFRETVLHSFAGQDGSHPISRLARNGFGTLFGTTFAGGANGLGTVFSLKSSGVETVLLSFTGGNGSHPRAGVVRSATGDLWGTTSGGGGFSLGVVFRMTFSGNTWSQSFLYSFAGADGAHPYSAVTLDTFGDVFGTTKAGGPACTFLTAGCGVVFEFQPSGNSFVENTIYDFTGGLDGAAPVADLTLALDANGNPYLYGTASEAGTIGGTCPTAGCGTAFELCGIGSSCQGAQTWTEYTLFEFEGKIGGQTPTGNLLAFPPVGASEDPWDFPPGGKAKCTSGCMSTPSSGGSSGDGTIDGFTN